MATAPTIATAEFDVWLEELNRVAAEDGHVNANQFWQSTGCAAWLPFYEDGVTPREALDQDYAA